MSADKATKLEPIIKADSYNITSWNHHLKDNVLRLGLSKIMSPEEAVRTAGALELNDYSPDVDSPAGYIDIEAFQQVQYARFQGNSAAMIAKREWVDEHLEQMFTTAVSRAKTLKHNVMLLGQWIVSSVHPDHATAIFGTHSFTQVYERARAIQSRFQSSDRHGVIYCINKLMTVKMKDETVVGAHTFTDDVSSLMLRLKGHLREGGLDVLTVMEIMVLIEGLPKSGPFALFALACSTDETLTATQFIERLHRQAERLAREQTSRRVSEELKTEDADTGVANSVGGGGGQITPDTPANKVKPPPNYWNGQQSKTTYQSVHWEDEGELEEDSQTQERGHNTGRGRGRGQGRGYRRSNQRQGGKTAKATLKLTDEEEESSFIF